MFSKHQARDVRDWSKLLMKNYQLMHAIEKPMNLDFVAPFANTSDYQKFTPKIDPNLAADRMEERLKPETDEVDIETEPKAAQRDSSEAAERQLFQFKYTQEATIAFLHRKMPYHYEVYRRILNEV